MKLYRIATFEAGESSGYRYVGNQDEARRIARENKASAEEVYGPGYKSIETIEVEPTKAGILECLNRYGSHPDNG